MAHIGARIASHNTHKPYPGQQVNWSNDLTNGLALLLPYQDKAGVNVYESVRNSYSSSVAYQATPTWNNNSNIGPAAGFTTAGFPNYISIANDATYGLQNPQANTLHMLLYPTNLSGTSDQYLVARQGIWSFQLSHSNSFTPLVNITASSSFPSISATTAPVANQWNVLTCTFSYTTPVTGSIWLNGVNVTNTVNGGTGTIGPDSGHAVTVQGLSSVTFLGYFGLFGWWTRMLTSAEILELHTNTWQLWKSDLHRYPTLPAIFTQNLPATMAGFSSALTKQTSKTISATMTGFAGALTKTTTKKLTATMAGFAGGVTKVITKNLTATMAGFAGSVVATYRRFIPTPWARTFRVPAESRTFEVPKKQMHTQPLLRRIKDPGALKDYAVDWSDWLDGDTITNAQWNLDPGITGQNPVIDNSTEPRIWISGGVVGRVYNVQCVVTTAGGRTDSYTFELAIQRT